MTDTKKETPPKDKLAKAPKKKGPIRTEAVVPFLIVAVATWAYFHFVFDHNLKSIFEFAGYHVVGAEVDIADVETSFWKASFRAQGIEITNSEKPEFNVIKIGDVRYSLLWDGLLRARFIVNEMAVEQIEFNSPRRQPGKVKPPEPPKPKSTEPSALEKEAMKLKDKAIEKAQEDYSGNVFGDIANMLGGSSGQDQISNIENSLPSKVKLKEFEKDFQDKQTKWNEKIKTLPQGKEIQALGDRLGKVKTKDFKTPQELQDSLQQIDAIFKEADAKMKQVQSTNAELNQDMKTLDTNFKDLDGLIKKDIKDLESRFKIPKIDAKSISHALFNQYMGPYMAMFYKYQGMAEKYVPPNIMKKVKGGGSKEVAEDDTSIKPHPRAKGVTYEFGRTNAYPLFWVKRISISSQAGTTKESGNIKGLVTDVTSNQRLVGKPTVATLEGNFPGLEIQALLAKLTIDTTKEESRIDYDFSVGSYGVLGKNLVSNNDVKIAFRKATGQMKSNGSLVGLTDFKFTMANEFQKIDYEVSAKNEVVDGVLKDVFKGIPAVTVDAKGHGELPDVAMDLESNLGPELSKGFEKQLQKKIEEARQKLQAAIDAAVGKEKAKLEADINKMKSRYEGELKKINDQINTQKNQAQAKVDQSKKDTENQGKKKIEQEGKKAIDDLKSKLGF